MIFSKHGEAFCFLCRLIPMRPRGIHGVVQRGFKRYFKQTEKCTSFFANASRCRHFPISPLFFENSTASIRSHYFWRLKGRKNAIFGKIFILLYLQNTCYWDMQFTCVSIHQYRSSYIIKNTDRLGILLWGTKASGHTIVLPQENHR